MKKKKKSKQSIQSSLQHDIQMGVEQHPAVKQIFGRGAYKATSTLSASTCWGIALPLK